MVFVHKLCFKVDVTVRVKGHMHRILVFSIHLKTMLLILKKDHKHDLFPKSTCSANFVMTHYF